MVARPDTGSTAPGPVRPGAGGRGLVPGLDNPHPLVTSLPAVWQGDSFTERFVSTFDDAVAPITSTLDNLPAYLDPNLTPQDFLPWLAGWVGLDLDENWSDDQQRRMVGESVQLLQWRGTRTGLVQLVRDYLDVAADHVEVEDSGGVAWSPTPMSDPPGDGGAATVQVRVRIDAHDVNVTRLRRLVASAVPAHVAHEVRLEPA